MLVADRAGHSNPRLEPCQLAVARLRTATATSAGGIVVRYEDAVPSLVLGMRRRERDRVTWTLPKGTPMTGETAEETAIREVGEETGLQVRITDRLPSIHYTFVQRGTRIYKTVHYFLMEPIGGDLAGHDQEFEEVRWTRFEDAADLLAFETERNLVFATAERIGAPMARVEAAQPANHPAGARGGPPRMSSQ